MNRTLKCSEDEIEYFSKKVFNNIKNKGVDTILNSVICNEMENIVKDIPHNIIDLIILDPPYNLSKDYNGYKFNKISKEGYISWFENIIQLLLPLLNDNGSMYVCSDWETSMLIYPTLSKYFIIKNRITWEREKGRGSKRNWKNNTEDIWFCVKSDKYKFNIDAVMLKKKVIAPYKDKDNKPKDWKEGNDGNFRLTCPSNIWTDITIPFWSMPENTIHPTQKPEKLLAKLILSSSDEDDIVLDPFGGSGTTAVVSQKLNRKFISIEKNMEYCCITLKRLEQCENNKSIQGYHDNIFWERNSLQGQKKNNNKIEILD